MRDVKITQKYLGTNFVKRMDMAACLQHITHIFWFLNRYAILRLENYWKQQIIHMFEKYILFHGDYMIRLD